jgi:hypothetical protein
MEDFTIIDDDMIPITRIYDREQDADVPIENYDFSTSFWSMKYVPSDFVLPSNVEPDIRKMITNMDENDIPCTIMRKIRKNDHLCEDTIHTKKRGKGRPPKSKKISHDDDIFEVERIVAHIGHWDNIENMQFKVRWRHYDENEDTWEPYCNLTSCKSKLEKYRKLNLLPSSLYLDLTLE